MRRLADLSIAVKILLGVGLLSLANLAIASYAVLTMNRLDSQYTEVVDYDSRTAVAVAEVGRFVEGTARQALRLVAEETPEKRQRIL